MTASFFCLLETIDIPIPGIFHPRQAPKVRVTRTMFPAVLFKLLLNEGTVLSIAEQPRFEVKQNVDTFMKEKPKEESERRNFIAANDSVTTFRKPSFRIHKSICVLRFTKGN